MRLLIDRCGIRSVGGGGCVVLMAVMVIIVDHTALRCIVMFEQVLTVGSRILLIICLAGRIRGSTSICGTRSTATCTTIMMVMMMILLAWSDLYGGTPLVSRVANLVLYHTPASDCRVG